MVRTSRPKVNMLGTCLSISRSLLCRFGNSTLNLFAEEVIVSGTGNFSPNESAGVGRTLFYYADGVDFGRLAEETSFCDTAFFGFVD